jgi:bifunctional non-homologous end joining protein LigD
MDRRRLLPPGFIEPCIQSLAHRPPSGPDWVHEVKHDGYRLIVRRAGETVRLFTRRGYDWTDAILQAFDLLELDGEDLRPLPLGQRKPRLARLLTRAQAGIALNEHTDAKGELIFRQACVMGLEGIVSKRLTAPYRSGPSRDWLKVKNPDSPEMVRHREGRW